MCGKNVTETSSHGLSCLETTGRCSSLNAQKRPDGLALVARAIYTQFLRDVTVVDSKDSSRIYAGSVWYHAMAAAEVKDRKKDQYENLVDDGCLFQLLAFEIQYAAGNRTEIFFRSLWMNLSICTEPTASSFLKRRISLATSILCIKQLPTKQLPTKQFPTKLFICNTL